MENLGKKAKDKVTGFSGVATSFHASLGCVDRYGIERLGNDGKPELEYFTKARLLFGDDIPQPRENVEVATDE